MRIAATALSAATMMSAALPASAAYTVDAWAYCTNNTSSLGPCPTYKVEQVYNDSTWPGPGVATVSVSNGHQGVLASANAQADYGVLKVSGHAEAVGGVPNTVNNIGDANATAFMSDYVTINSPGVARFTDAVMTATFAVSGGYFRNGAFAVPPGAFDGYTASTQGNWDVSIFNSYYHGYESGTLYQTGYDEILKGIDLGSGVYDTSVSSAFGQFTVQVPIMIGEGFDIRFNLAGRTYALAFGDGTSSYGDFDLGHSMYWGGISSISINGSEVPFSLSSQSSHDWIQSSIPSSVPVPAAVWLFGSALLGLARIGRRTGNVRRET